MSDVRRVAVLPDGRTALTGDALGAVRLWDLDSGRELRRLDAHAGVVTALRLDASGRRALSGGADRTARLWDLHTGAELRRFDGHTGTVYDVGFLPDGRRGVTVADDGTLRVWEFATGKETRRLHHQGAQLFGVLPLPDGRRAVTWGSDRTARVWDLDSGTEVRRLENLWHSGMAVSLLPGGVAALAVRADRTLALWHLETGAIRPLTAHGAGLRGVEALPGDRAIIWAADLSLRATESGRVLRVLVADGDEVHRVAPAPDRRHVLTAGRDGAARLLRLDTGREVRRLEGRTQPVQALALSADGRRLVAGGWNGMLAAWDLPAAREGPRLDGLRAEAWSVAVSPDARLTLAGQADGHYPTWDLETGDLLRRPKLHRLLGRVALILPDGRRVLSGSGEGVAYLWDLETGAALLRLEGHRSTVAGLALIPGGVRAVTASWDRTARVWDLATGREVRVLTGHTLSVNAVVALPDGQRVVTGAADGTLRVWEIDTGREVRRLEAHKGGVDALALLPDGRRLLSAGRDRDLRLWDLESGTQLRRMTGHASHITGLAVLPGGRRAFSGSWDGTVRLWDLEAGRELCSLVSFTDGSWAVTDPDGRYDAAHDGDVEGLHWVLGREPIDLRQFRARYYDPGLLAKHLGLSREPLRRVADFGAVRLYPTVQVAPLDRNGVARVSLTNRGGGIGRVVIQVNGKEVLADARGPRPNPAAPRLTLALAPHRYHALMEPGVENSIEVAAFNGDGTVVSRGTRIAYVPPTRPGAAPPRVWALVAGVSDYRGDRLDLRYAARDAERFAGALRLAVAGLKLPLDLRLLIAAPAGVAPAGAGPTGVPPTGGPRPSKAAILAALRDFRARAAPGDVLVVYLAGHGVNLGGEQGDYYFLTESAADSELKDAAARRQDALSGRELGDLLIGVPALKQVVILDTCAAGRGLERLAEGRDVPGVVRRSWADLRERSGVFLLAGCAADAVSYEASRFGQGLLTYSLLEALQGPAVEPDGTVRVQRWLEHAARRVPQLARAIRGVQQPVLSNRRDAVSFPIGRLDEAGRRQIPVARLKPVLVRPRFQEAGRLIDPLGLEGRVEEVLRERTARGEPEAPAVYWDVAEAPDAYRLVGEYRRTGSRVAVRAFLYRGDREVGTAFTAEGEAAALPGLAETLVRLATQRLPSAP